MKQITLILALLFALTANAYATDIILSGQQTTQIPFNPSNLGNTRTITVTATNASASVTSSAAFPTAIVGKSGFTISIGGVFYTVAAVQSTSSLTLTKAFTGVTGSTSLLLYPYTLFRAFPTAGFQSSTVTSTTATIAVVNGSATVTSSALFPAMYTGVAGGYQVLIDGVPYQVLWQASTSSLTLTQTYAGTTGAATMTFDGVAENVQPSAPGGQWFKEVAVSVVNLGAGNVLYYPPFVMPATTNATVNNQARYVFAFYRPDNSQLAVYQCGSVSQLAIQASTPTTWTAICTFNSPGGVVPPNTEVYTKSQEDQMNPPCVAGQSVYYATNGSIRACLNYGSGLTLTGNTLTASGGGGSITDYRGAINVSKAPYSCVGDGVASDQACLAAAITAAAAAGGKIVYIPAGTYLVTGLTVPGGVTLVGDGKMKTIITSTTNAVILDLVTGSGAYATIAPKVSDLWVKGSDSGAGQIGIQVTDASAVALAEIDSVLITDCGSHGLSIGNAFSSSFTNIYSSSNIGYNFFYNAPNMPTNYFHGLYSADVNVAAPAGYRIKQGTFVCHSCNGVNVVPATSYWAVIGGKAGDIDGDVGPFFANARFVDCNIEGTTTGVLNYPGSVPSFDGMTAFVGVGVTPNSYKAIDFDTDASLSPEISQRGYIADTVTFSNSPITYYVNSQPVHADGNPPIQLDGQGLRVAGVGILNTYYNSANSRAEQINRADGSMGVVSVTATTSFTNPGLRYLEVTCAAPCTQSLPSASFYNASDQVVIKNFSATGITVTINANSGSSVNGSAYTISTIGESVTLIPNGASDWRVVGERFNSGVAPRIPFYSASNTLTTVSGLEYDAGSAAVVSPGRFYAANTSASFPSFAFTSDPTTGFYRSGASTIGIATGGANTALFGTTGLLMQPYGASTGETGNVRLRELSAGGSEYVGLRAPDAIGTSFNLTLPNALPGSTLCLAFSATGVGSYTACSAGSGSPGGSDTEVQFNQLGSFGGITGATSDGTNMTFGSANLRATRPRFTTSIDDSSGNELLIVTATGSAVNEITLANAATGNNPTFTASGGDTNVGINFVPKGSGTIQVSGVPIVTTTAAQSLTNKTLTASSNVLGGVTMTLGSDADGDMYYRASGVLTRLPKGTALQQLRMNAGATAPEWATISGGGTITGSGSTGTIAKFTGSSAIGDSLLSESGSTVTTAGRQTITGLTINADATNTVASLTANATFTKNNSNPRDFFGVLIKPTFNFGGSNSATIVSILEVDSVNTNVTGLTTNLLSLKYGGNIAFNVDSDGGITFANGIRQAFAPSTIVASLNVGQVAADPSSPVNGDVVYETNTNKFRCYENSAWVNCISSGANTALSNLASVAINTSLLSDTTLTDDLGSASFYWRRAYAGQYFADATISAVSGNQTINRALFSFVIGSGTTNAVITNSFVTTSSLVICTPQKKDATALTVSAEPASGSVTITTNAGATNDMPVACIVYNQ